MRLFRMLNVVNVQCRGYYDDFSMNVFNIVIALMVQRRRLGAIISMDVYPIMYALVVQRRRCCSFDSPGLARNEPTLGKRLQGDSTL